MAAETDKPGWRPTSPEPYARGVLHRGGGVPDVDDWRRSAKEEEEDRLEDERLVQLERTQPEVELNAHSIDGASIAQLWSYRSPPDTVHDVLRAVLLALGQALTFETKSWADCRRMLADHEGFAHALYDEGSRDEGHEERWTRRRIDAVRRLLEGSADVDGGPPRATSDVAGALWEWADEKLRLQEQLAGYPVRRAPARRQLADRSPSIDGFDSDRSPRTTPRRLKPQPRGRSRSRSRSRSGRRRSRSRSVERNVDRTPGSDRSARSPLADSDAGYSQFAERGGELRVTVESCKLSRARRGKGDAPLPHPYVQLSLAGYTIEEQKTKTKHKTTDPQYFEEFRFAVPRARAPTSRSPDPFTGDGLLEVKVMDARGYGATKKRPLSQMPVPGYPVLLGDAQVDLYEEFGPNGRWRRVPGGRPTRQLVRHTCVLNRRDPDEPVQDDALGEDDDAATRMLASAKQKAARAVGRMASAVSPQRIREGVLRKGGSLRQDQVSRWTDEEAGEVVLTMEFEAHPVRLEVRLPFRLRAQASVSG